MIPRMSQPEACRTPLIFLREHSRISHLSSQMFLQWPFLPQQFLPRQRPHPQPCGQISFTLPLTQNFLQLVLHLITLRPLPTNIMLTDHDRACHLFPFPFSSRIAEPQEAVRYQHTPHSTLQGLSTTHRIKSEVLTITYKAVVQLPT